MIQANSLRIAALVVVLAAAGAAADITQTNFLKLGQISEAESLLHQEKYEQAQAAFEQLAAEASNEVDKSKFEARAAIALGRSDGGYDSGMRQAQAIEHRPYAVYAQMQLMLGGEEYELILERFKDEPIDEWPDHMLPPGRWDRWSTSAQNVKVFAFRARGLAFYETENGEAADEDLRRAVDLCNGQRKGDQWLMLTLFETLIRNASQQLEDQEKAQQYQMRAVKEIDQFAGKSNYMVIVAAVANRLREAGEYDHALQVLDRANLKDRTGGGTWFGVGQLGYGRVYADKAKAQAAEAARLLSAGRTDEAEALLKQVEQNREQAISFLEKLAKNSDAREGHREEAQKMLVELR